MPHADGLYYESHGPAGGDPLVLVAGLGGSAEYWRPNIAAFAAAGRRVVAFDQRGGGRSDPVVDGPPTMEAIGRDVAALMDALGIARATIVGHATGGMAGLSLALTAPNRVARLVVVNGWARLDPYTARCFDARLALLRSAGPRAYLHAQPIFLYPPGWTSSHADELAAEEEAQIAAFPGAEMVERRIAAARAFDLSRRIGALAVPTLLIASDDDAFVPATCSAWIKGQVPTAQLARLAHGGHACNRTRPDHFNLWLLDWLDG